MENKILQFECIGIKNNGKFPVENTGRGRDLSPEFQFYNLLGNAKTLAITLEDLSHPIKNFTHWVVWNIPAASQQEKMCWGLEMPSRELLMGCTGMQGQSLQKAKSIVIVLQYMCWIVNLICKRIP